MWTNTRAPAALSRPHPLKLPFKHPPQLDPSCVLALLPQWDDKWVDYSGHGNHGIVHGAIPTAKSPFGFAYEFDGVDDLIRVPNSPSVNVTGDITVELILALSLPLPVTVLQQPVHKELQFTLAIRTVDLAVSWADSSLWSYNIFGWYLIGLQTSLHHHIVAAKHHHTVRIYRQGTERLVRPHFGGPLSATPNDVAIASYDFAHGFLKGLITLVRIYNRAWSPNPADPNYLPEIDPVLQGWLP